MIISFAAAARLRQLGEDQSMLPEKEAKFKVEKDQKVSQKINHVELVQHSKLLRKEAKFHQRFHDQIICLSGSSFRIITQWGKKSFASIKYKPKVGYIFCLFLTHRKTFFQPICLIFSPKSHRLMIRLWC